MGISLLGYAANLRFNQDQFVSLFTEMKGQYRRALLIYTLTITPIILCVIFPVLTQGYATSVYRVGPDIASYAKMSQYLLDGGTWAAAGLRANEFLGMSVGEINRYSEATMSWPFMYHFRWGLTAFQVAVANITLSSRAFETAFLSMALPYLLMCGLVLIWLRKHIHLGWFSAALGTVAFTFNANLLNIWYEGFYGNLFMLVFYIPILYIFFDLRGRKKYGTSEIKKSVVFSAILIAAGLFSYAEGVVFVLATFMLFLFVVDIVINRRISWPPYLVLLAGACIGLILVFPCGFIVEWALLAIKQITQEGGNGYAQPFWAFPHEILGLNNIYLSVSNGLVGTTLIRRWRGVAYAVAMSVLILYVLLNYFKKERREENVLYIASMLMVAITACLVFYKSHENNYTYMKMYVFHLPILFVAFWGSLRGVYEKYFAESLRGDFRWFYVLISLPMIISGLVYIAQYKVASTSIEKFSIELHEETKNIDFRNVVMYPVLLHDTRYAYMYATIFPIYWMLPYSWSNPEWKRKLHTEKFMGYKVYLFVEKEKGREYVIPKGQIIFENKFCLIVDSGKMVSNGINAETKQIDFDRYTALLD